LQRHIPSPLESRVPPYKWARQGLRARPSSALVPAAAHSGVEVKFNGGEDAALVMAVPVLQVAAESVVLAFIKVNVAKRADGQRMNGLTIEEISQ
jgi:hypothetical protein